MRRLMTVHIWARNSGQRIQVKIPPGCLLVQAGKQLEWATGGLIKGPYCGSLSSSHANPQPASTKLHAHKPLSTPWLDGARLSRTGRRTGSRRLSYVTVQRKMGPDLTDSSGTFPLITSSRPRHPCRNKLKTVSDLKRTMARCSSAIRSSSESAFHFVPPLPGQRSSG